MKKLPKNTPRNCVVTVGALFFAVGIILLFIAETTSAFTAPDKARELFFIDWEDYEKLGAADTRYAIWNEMMASYRTAKFLYMDIGILFSLLGVLAFCYSRTFKTHYFPFVPSDKWTIIIWGLVGYALIVFQTIFDISSDTSRYPMPFFKDAHVRAFASLYVGLLLFSPIILLIGFLMLNGRRLGIALLYPLQFQNVFKQIVFLLLFLFFSTGLVLSFWGGILAFSAAGFLIWIWVILCTRASWLNVDDSKS
jgi:hypothetical protein